MDIILIATFLAAILSFFIVYILIGIFNAHANPKSRILVSFLTAILSLIFFAFMAVIVGQVSLITL
ncbi:hypothetical protein [Saccharibacillus sacchari]|uniref:hypothetical protein n=1 Tax=Saccharibacillus sacchari TaxID=456493 RepID=UPI0004AD0C49|nr:hypothetical protein [Saccharibacillus sacchari]